MDVLNARDLPKTGWPENTLYIGRNTQLLARSGVSGPSIHGNPFRMVNQSWDERRRVVDAHRGYLSGRMQDPAFKATVGAMTGKNLVCHCAPQACHGHTYATAIQALDQGKPVLAATPAHHLQMTVAVANGGTALKDDPHPSAKEASVALRSLAFQHVASGAMAKGSDNTWRAHPNKMTATPELVAMGQQAHKSISEYITQRGAETLAGIALTRGLVVLGRELDVPQRTKAVSQAEAEF